MSLKNASVVLTYKLDGALAISGSYDYREMTTSGGILPEDQRLFILRKSRDCDCFQRVELTPAFVNYAITDAARPNRNEGGFKAFRAYTYWRKMSDLQRLNYHIAKFVSDINASSYECLINEQ